MAEPEEEKQVPLHGAFTLVTSADSILLIRTRNTDMWELPGGGVDDGEESIETAMREAQEEAKIRLRKKRMLEIATLEQRVPKRGPDAVGTVTLFLANSFAFPFGEIRKTDGVVMNKRLNAPETSDESQEIRLVCLSEIFSPAFRIGLAHKRLILHWLNWSSALMPSVKINGKLRDPVTATVPKVGKVTA